MIGRQRPLSFSRAHLQLWPSFKLEQHNRHIHACVKEPQKILTRISRHTEFQPPGPLCDAALVPYADLDSWNLTTNPSPNLEKLPRERYNWAPPLCSTAKSCHYLHACLCRHQSPAYSETPSLNSHSIRSMSQPLHRSCNCLMKKVLLYTHALVA